MIVVAGLAVLAAGGLVALAPASDPVAPVAPAALAPRPPERMATGPLLGRRSAWFTLGDAASRVRVRLAPLPGQLYRISTSPDAGVAPVVSRRGGRVLVRLTATGDPGLDEVRIVLNRSVRWDIRLPAGAGEQHLNLRDGRLRRVVVGEAGLSRMWLPEPRGTVPVTFAGGVGTVSVSVRGRAPVRIRFAQGAGSVDTPWTANNGTAAGAVLREPGFRQATNRYLIRARGGIGALVVHRVPATAGE